MASVMSKGKMHYVVYRLPKVLGKDFFYANNLKYKPGEQIWEKYDTKEEAEKRLPLVERQIEEIKRTEGRINHLVVPALWTLRQYVERKFWPARIKDWKPKTYQYNKALLQNHILPHMGDSEMEMVCKEDILDFYDKLRHTLKGSYKEGVWVLSKEKEEREHAPEDYLSSKTIHGVAQLLSSIFRSAVEDHVILSSPVPTELPSIINKEADFWEDDTVLKALENMEEDRVLRLAIHCSYVGALRNGEVGAISLDDIDLQNRRIRISKTLQRVLSESLEAANTEDLIYVFPTEKEKSKTRLILKGTKTEKSTRYLLMTEPLLQEVEARIEQIKLQRKVLGDEYHNYGLLCCLDNGNPMEPKLIMKRFRKWQMRQYRDHGEWYPSITFHGIRHSSITYLVEECEGDFKSVQRVSGHNTYKMLLEKYAHSTEKGAKRLNKIFEEKFYKKHQPAEQGPEEPKPETPEAEEKNILEIMVQSAKTDPEIRKMLIKLCMERPELQKNLMEMMLTA